MHVRLTKPVPTLALGLVLAAALTGCGSSSSDGSTGTSSGTSSSSTGASGSTDAPSSDQTGDQTSDQSSGQTLDITVKGDDVEPENQRIEVDKSKPLTLKITSDRAGELHVHSSPEQHVEFSAGTTTKQLTFTVPGVIELEEHKSDSLIAQLEVR